MCEWLIERVARQCYWIPKLLLVTLAAVWGVVITDALTRHTPDNDEPMGAWNAVFVAASFLLSGKLLAISSAVIWIPRHHRAFTAKLNELEGRGGCYHCNRFQALGVGEASPPFGIMDRRPLAMFHRWMHSPRPFCRAFGLFVTQVWDILFGVSNLCLVTSALLIVAAYSGRAGSGAPRFAASMLSLLSLNFMAIEIVIGLSLMRDDYPRHLHGRGDPPAGSPVLRQLLLLANLIFAGIATATASCLTWSVLLRGAFGGAMSDALGTNGEKVLPLSINSLSFVVTTLLTIGYGDIFPAHIGARLMMIAIHTFGILALVLTLQIAVSLGTGDPNDHRQNEGAEAPAATACWLASVVTFVLAVAMVTAVVVTSCWNPAC